MDDLGKSFPASEGMIDAEENVKPAFHNECCLNCGTRLTDSFCPHCGQKDIPRRQTLGELFTNFISSFWSYEGKFFRTTKYLIIKPGFLAAEYNVGRRESYYHPARMYVFISFVFFLIYFSLPEEKEQVEMSRKEIMDLEGKFSRAQLDSIVKTLPTDKSDSAIKILPPELLDTIRGYRGNYTLQDSEYNSVEQYDSIQNTLPEKDRHGWLMRTITLRSIELNKKYEGKSKGFAKDFGSAFQENFSKVLFYLLPFFALLLKLLYVRRDYYYSEHLVFSIYYYNFFYLAGSLMMLFNLIPWLGWLSTLIGFWIYFYLLFGMKRMYGQRWGKTIFKFILFSFCFSLLLALGLFVNLIATVFLL